MVDKIAVGRRKTSVARVVIRPGSGKIVVNGKDINEYFKTKIDTLKATEPLKAVDAEGKYDFLINVKGGGVTGQVGAISLGIARALVLVNPDYRPSLRNLGYLTRDPRMVERKKIRPTESSKEIPILKTLIVYFIKNFKRAYSQIYLSVSHQSGSQIKLKRVEV